MTNLFRPAIDLVADLQARRLSARALMQETLDRIAQVNGKVNALVALRSEAALMAEAEACDEGPIKGPLHGLPIAVKDLVNTQGIASTQGSPILADFVPQQDDLLAARLRAAGAILIGKTNVPEFGLGSHTFNPVYGTTLNPYDAARTCGGSSGGAAVALATGMTALADGSDMMGSLRNPAAWNNVYGFRPSWGRVPSEPAGDLYLHQLSTLGPMARSPADMALLLDVLAGADPRSPLTASAPPAHPLAPLDLSQIRIGWLGDWGGAFPYEAGIAEQCLAGLEVFRALGCQVEEVAPPFPADKIWDAWTTLRSFTVASGLRALRSKREQLKDTAQWELDRGLSYSAMDIQNASESRSDWFRAAARLFDRYDALVLPAAQVWPFPVELDWPKSIAGVEMDTYHRWMQVVTPVSLLGLPCLSIPVGFGQAGLPMGAQLFGRLGNDANLLSLAQAYHQETQWPSKRPPPL
ncbi:MAG: amidase [Rhodobacteraceae bacterium]|nr:amidase [Paracoccaceae bacterium]